MRNLWNTPELGRWSEGAKIGEGGMGEVYAATDRVSGEPRAVKFVLPQRAEDYAHTVRLFRREMQMCEALRHRQLVQTYATGAADGVCFVVMEFCSGGNLADMVVRDGPLPPGVALPMIVDVLDGLTYAHTAKLEARDAKDRAVPVTGVVHRDIKPQNILLVQGPDGRSTAKIGDFGLAKAYELSGLSMLTEKGEAWGSPAFMPRAQVLNYRYVRPEVDVWATAATLYFALTGRTPRDFHVGRDPWRTVLDDPPVPVGARGVALPDGVAAVLDEALIDREGTDPAFPTAALLRASLELSLRDRG